MSGAAGELDSSEWDFSSVPAAELPACFLWEYARESAWIIDLSKRCIELPLHTPDGEAYFEALESKYSIDSPKENDIEIPSWRDDFETPEGKKWMKDLTDVSNGSYPPCIDADISFHLPLWIQDGLILDAWQRLSADVREGILHEVSEMKVALEKPLLYLIEKELEHFSSIHRKLEGRMVLDRRNHIQGVDSFSISWDKHTNREIVNAFREWVKINRPKIYFEPRKNGDKTEDRRAWLKWLGVMRALHHHSVADFRFPDAIRSYGESKTLYAMRTKARDKFQEIFSFLPEPREPISFLTKAKAK